MNMKLSRLSKSPEVMKRLDKLNIFEYFNFTSTRQVSRKYEQLDIELALFIFSDVFHKEFSGYFDSFHNNELFRFFLLNRNLLRNRIKIQQNGVKQKFEFFNSNLITNEFLQLFINKELVVKGTYIIEDELLKNYKKDELYLLRNKLKIDTAVQSNDKAKVSSLIRKFVFKDKENIIKEDKISTFIIAHKNYIDTLDLDDIFKYKVHWGLDDVKLLNSQ